MCDKTFCMQIKRLQTPFKGALVSILAAFLLSACSPGRHQKYDPEEGYSGTLSISGAFALYPMAVLWAEDFKKENPNVRFNVSAGGAGKGISDVLSNMVDIGLVSRELHQVEVERGALPIVVGYDAVISIINRAHPDFDLLQERGLTQAELKSIFLEKGIKTWKEIDARLVDRPIEVYTRSDAAGAAETWAKYLGATQEELRGIGIFGDPGLAQAVRDNPLAIGFSNVNFVYDLKTRKSSEGVHVLPLDLNANGRVEDQEQFYETLDKLMHAVAEGAYPSPPARELYFVLHRDRPSALLNAFVRFVLAKEQQNYLSENGYVPLEKEKIEQQIHKIDATKH